MKPQSCKSKGRRFQQRIVSSIIDAFPHLTHDDVRSTSMGAQGEDILMSPRARACLPLSIECKCVERLNVWQALEQASSNAHKHVDSTPCVVFARNRSCAYAVLPWDCVVEMYKRASAYPFPPPPSSIQEERGSLAPLQARTEAEEEVDMCIENPTCAKFSPTEDLLTPQLVNNTERIRDLILQLYQLI